MIDDLLWILNAPPLMRDKSPCTDSAHEWLSRIKGSLNYEVPLQLNNQQEQYCRLGLYYENLVSIALNIDSELIDIKRNIQVRDKKVTLGEYDFIGERLNGESNSHFHLECAIKYYLCRGDGSELSHFIGPNKNDCLEVKYNKLLNKQLKLSSTAAGKQECKKNGLEPTQLLMLLQGYLFYPFGLDQPQASLHQDISPEHYRGWWLYENEIDALNKGYQFALLEKPYWLSIYRSKSVSFDEIKRAVLPVSKPILVCRVDTTTQEEVDRGFIVPNDW